MSNLPSVSGRDAIRAFTRLGFVLSRVSGSHHILKKPGHPTHLSVPVHGNRSLKFGTLRGIIADAGVTPEEFAANL